MTNYDHVNINQSVGPTAGGSARQPAGGYQVYAPRRFAAVHRRVVVRLLAAVASGLPVTSALAADESPQGLVVRISNDVLQKLKADPAIQNGDVGKVVALVDSDVLPNVDLARMTADATGRAWREATASQRTRLEQEFGQLVVRTYAGALTQVKNETIGFFPQRQRSADGQAEVRSEIHGAGDPVHVDYRLALTPTGWKIVDVGVMGAWLTETYRGSFQSQIDTHGIDGLIATLAAKNKANGG